MQNFFQEFISFLLNSWKSLIFLFVFSYVLKETIGRVFLNILRGITHLIIDFSNNTVSTFYSNDWQEDFNIQYFTNSMIWRREFEIFNDIITNQKIRSKYLNLINRYNSFLESSFLFAILSNSKYSSKLTKKIDRNINYILPKIYLNEIMLIALLFINKIKFFLFKIYVYSKTIYVFNQKYLINNFKKSIKKVAEEKEEKKFRHDLYIRNLPPIKDLRLLLDLNWYSDCVIGEQYDGEFKFLDLSAFYKGSYSQVSDAQELVYEIKESDFLRNIKYDVFFSNIDSKKELNINCQILKSSDFSTANRLDYELLVSQHMMLRLWPAISVGSEYLCPYSKELNYEYSFVSNIEIDEVIQLIEKLEGMVSIYISQGNLEESLKEHLNSKSIRTHKNYFYLSKIQKLKERIDNGFKYIDYTFILIWFIISIFIEQNYFVFLETSISSLLEFFKYYFLINHLI